MRVMVTDEQRMARQEYLNSLTSGRRMFLVSELKEMKPTFQRTLNRSQVKTIIREWQTWRFDDPVVCVCSDGTMLLDDGQHRIEAAIEKLGPDAEILCRLAYTDLPGEEFVKLNTSRRGVTAYWKYVAQLSDGDDVAVGIVKLAESHGLSINHGSGCYNISAVNTVIALYKRDAMALDRTLNILTQVINIRENEVGWLKANVIQAVWYVICNYDCRDITMIRGLAKTTPDRVAPHSANDMSRNAGDVIIAYNKNQRNHLRLNVTQPKKPQ
jgi:hypothetical protein